MSGFGLGFGFAYVRSILSRGGGFSPDSLSGLAVWVDGETGYTDKSGNSLTITNESTTINATAINGLGAFVFNGSTAISYGKQIVKPSSFTVFGLVRKDTNASNLYAFGSTDSGGATSNTWGTTLIKAGGVVNTQFGEGVDPLYWSGNTDASPVTSITEWYRVAIRYTSGNTFAEIFVNGTNEALTPALTGADDCTGTTYDYRLGQLGEFTGSRFQGEIAEHFIYTEAKTDQEIADLDTYLVDKYYNPMRMTIDTTQAGSASDTFIFPLTSMGGLASIQIAWGDGSSSVITAVGQAELTHVYAVGGIKNLTVMGAVGYIWQALNLADKKKIVDLTNWGNSTAANGMLKGTDAIVTATDIPIVTTSLSQLAQFNAVIESIPNLASWDTSLVTNWNAFYGSCNSNNQDFTGVDFSGATSGVDFCSAGASSFTVDSFDKWILNSYAGGALTGRQPVTGSAWGFGTNQYSSAVQTEYDALVTYGIVFTDGGVAP